jgi:hypothetical protein
MSKTNRTNTIVTEAADTTVLPVSTNTRAGLLRQQAERETARAAERQAAAEAAVAANAALDWAIDQMCGGSAAPARVRAPRGEGSGKMTAYYNGLVDQAVARGMTHMTVNGRVYQIRARKHNFTGATGGNMVAALEAALAR